MSNPFPRLDLARSILAGSILLIPLVGASQASAQQHIGNLSVSNIRLRDEHIQLTPHPDCINLPYCQPEIDLDDIELPPQCDPRYCDPPEMVERIPAQDIYRLDNLRTVEQLQRGNRF